MKIVTGVGENDHITSKEFRRFIECIAGQGSYIIECGANMSTELVSNNLLKIKGGAMIHHGNISSVDPYDEIEINTGTQGMKRIDLVVNRYTKNAETEIEKNEWIVIQGVPAESNPAVPEHIKGNLQDGDLVDDCPFCQIYIDGINVTEVKELLTIIPNVPDLVAENEARKKEVAELNSKTTHSLAINNSYMSGTIYYAKRCGCCNLYYEGMIDFDAIGTKNTRVVIASGLPKAIFHSLISLQQMETSDTATSNGQVHIRVSSDGNIEVNNNGGVITGERYCFIGGTYGCE